MKNNEQIENVDSIANDEVEEDDEDDISYANDSLEINNEEHEVDEDPMNEFNEIDKSYLNYERTNRRDMSELNHSVNNTITAVTLINNNNNNSSNMNLNLNMAPAEITSSLTSFSSMSSSTTNSNLNTEMAMPKEEEASSMSPSSSSSSTASTSPTKFASLLSSCSLNETPKPQSLNIECTFDFVASSQFNMSSPVYLSSPSSLSCTPVTNQLAMKEAIEQQLTNEMNELKCEPVASKQAPRSAIPIIKTGSSLQHNQKIIPELGAKFSQLKPKVVRNLYENSLKEIKQINAAGSEEKLLMAGIADFYKKAASAAAAAASEIEIEEEVSRVVDTVSPQPNQHNLHNHVCTIANKCTCEKKFLVDKIGEGKYRIGNTKNIVFIRVTGTWLFYTRFFDWNSWLKLNLLNSTVYKNWLNKFL